MTQARTTVYDVARLAGVSRGTVDRVMNRRGRVSDESRMKVEEAVRELGYEPNASASLLASRRTYRIAVLIPMPGEADYWRRIDDGFSEGELQTGRFLNIELLRYYYDQTDSSSFESEAAKLLEAGIDGAILTDVFQLATRNLAAELHSRHIPYAFVDTKDESLPYVLHYGVNPVKSGELAAYLLGLAAGEPKEIALIGIRRDPSLLADPNRARREGFIGYVGEHFPGCKLYPVFLDISSPPDIFRQMTDFVNTNPSVRNFAVLCSRTYLLREWLAANPDPERVVIGFDDLDANMEALRDGLVTFLVTRHISHQSRDILSTFATYLAGGVLPEDRNVFVHMDILSKMNIDDYK